MDRWRPDVVHAHALQTLGADLLAEAAARGHRDRRDDARSLVVVRPPVPRRHPTCGRARSTPRRATARAPDRRVASRSGRPAGRRAGGVDQILVPSAALRDVVLLNGVAPERVDVDENDVDPAVDRHHRPSTRRVGRARRPLRLRRRRPPAEGTRRAARRGAPSAPPTGLAAHDVRRAPSGRRRPWRQRRVPVRAAVPAVGRRPPCSAPPTCS